MRGSIDAKGFEERQALLCEVLESLEATPYKLALHDRNPVTSHACHLGELSSCWQSVNEIAFA
jgi:hypothetical protein